MGSILNRIHTFFCSFFSLEKSDRLKLFLLSLAFLLIIGGYTVIRTLKDTLFVSLVGQNYIPVARFWSIPMLVPGVMLFSKLVDVLRREQLVYLYSAFYGIGGIIIASLLSHPTIGLPNVEAGPERLFGWIIYLFIEGFNPFLVSIFWSFVNSITSPDEARVNYPIMVAASKIGGMIMSSLGLYLLQLPFWSCNGYLGEITAHQALFIIASLVLLIVPICIHKLVTAVPRRHLHGYEAAYKADKAEAEAQHAKPHEAQQSLLSSIAQSLYSMFSGIILLIRYPYALGMFGIVFFWEVVNSFISFERLGVKHASLTAQTCYLLNQDFLIHAGGFLIVLVGTRVLVELIGERKSLILVPCISGILLAYYYSAPSALSMKLVYVILRLVNFAFAVPLRERLYTPTIKAIKFKSKSWIDSFGAKLAKGAGSAYNLMIMGLSDTSKIMMGTTFFSTVIGTWIVVAHCMGKSFERAVSRNEVIGIDHDKQPHA